MLNTLQILYDYHERCGISNHEQAIKQVSGDYGVDEFFIKTIDAMGSYGQAGHAIGAHTDIEQLKQQLHQNKLDPSMVAIKRIGRYYVVYSKIPTHRLPWPVWQNQQS
jgi:hypothetical protein